MPTKKATKKGTKKTAKKGAKKAAKKKAKKPAPRKKAAPKKKATPKKKVAKKAAKKPRKPNAAFMKPMMPSAELGAVVGAKPMPRTEVTKKLWEYIRKYNLQDSVNRRMINPDEKLAAVFGSKKQVSMFDMTKLVAKQLK